MSAQVCALFAQSDLHVEAYDRPRVCSSTSLEAIRREQASSRSVPCPLKQAASSHGWPELETLGSKAEKRPATKAIPASPIMSRLHVEVDSRYIGKSAYGSERKFSEYAIECLLEQGSNRPPRCSEQGSALGMRSRSALYPNGSALAHMGLESSWVTEKHSVWSAVSGNGP